MALKEKIKILPTGPGVYIFRDNSRRVIYIGKAASLRKRVASHFKKGGFAKDGLLQEKVTDLEYIPTSSEADALLWEASLIKEKQPRYNVNYRDDKSYPLLKITIGERFPRLFMGRGRKGKGLLYFGPYTNTGLLKEALKVIRRIFPYRSCRRLPEEPCLYYSLALCPAPCAGKISQEDYKRRIQEICLFLAGKRETLKKHLAAQMQEKANCREFEQAAEIRDKIMALAQLKNLRFGKETLLYELQERLRLTKVPWRIEAFDVSHLSGREATGAMVSFYQGIPDKDNYRRFKIRVKAESDDFSMIREIVRRRYGRLKAEKLSLPDLILIDGGRAHLDSAQRELEKLGIDKIDIISLAKGREQIYTINRKKPLSLTRDSRLLQLLQRVRDEAHRFALIYHKKLRRNAVLRSELNRIRGIGAKRRRELLRFFASPDKIAVASLEELLKVKGMNRAAAMSLIDYFER